MIPTSKLVDPVSLIEYPLDPGRPFLAGRAPTLDLPLRDRECSRLQFRIEKGINSFDLVSMSSTSETLVDGRPVLGRTALNPGAEIKAGRYRLIYRVDVPERSATPPPPDDQTIMHVGGPDLQAFDTAPIIIPEGKTLVIGRDAQQADVLLSHPRVSRLHARIERMGDTAVIVDTSSANGTFVDGRRLAGGTTIRPGSRIDIGPFALVFDGVSLIPGSRSNNLEIVASGLSRTVSANGRSLKLLDDISLVIWPREFVALLGPSGAGKSTLLDCLSGREPTNSGRVLINGQNLHKCFDALKQDIALVPQYATMHDSLTLGQALQASARLRLPRDTSRVEIKSRVNAILRSVGLSDKTGVRVGKLSGGQKRRAALANEVLNQPNLLFLDEVTSGLDEQADRQMMQLFRTFADAGKTVVCVTHCLANVERNCHLVVFLTPGGMLAFVGTPQEALGYFQVDRLGDIYEMLLDPSTSPESWRDRFRASTLFETYVTSRLAMAGRSESQVSAATPGRVALPERLKAFASQFLVLTQRSIRIQAAELRSWLMAGGQSIAVAFILYLVFRDVSAIADPAARIMATRKLLYLMAISSAWFGCNNAAREIVRERAIYRRERDVNLQATSYLASKLTLLGLTSVIQVGLLLGLVSWLCHPPIESGRVFCLLALLGMTGVTGGLLVSSIAAAEAIAVSLVPIVLIPQIALAGLIAPLRDVALWFARALVSTFWGYEGLTHTLSAGLTTLVPGDGPGPATASIVLLIHITVLTTATLYVLLGQQGRSKDQTRSPGWFGRRINAQRTGSIDVLKRVMSTIRTSKTQ